MTNKVCVIVGVGPGVGQASAQRFSDEGFQVVMIARDAERLKQYESEIPNSHGLVADSTDEQSIHQAIKQVIEQFGAIDTLIYNAARGTFGSILEVSPKDMEINFQVNTMGLLYTAQAVAAHMVEQGSGNIMVTGNTSSLRGKAHTTVFAPTKAAQRILTESIARELGPKGIHVSYIVIDAVIDIYWARERFPEKPDEFFAQPNAIADTIWHLTQQPKSAWSFQVDLRPFGETW